MAYRAIASTETDPDAPITSSLAKAWTDNLLAALAGNSTAPKVQDAAFANGSISMNRIYQDSAVTNYVGYGNSNLAYLAVGSYGLGFISPSGGTPGSTYSGSSITTAGGSLVSGTWKSMGRVAAGGQAELFVRVA